MWLEYLQLQHAAKVQAGSDIWDLSPSPVFNYMAEVSYFKGFISRCYNMKGFPSRAVDRWEQNVGQFAEEQWNKVLQAIPACSLSVSQRLTQLYIALRVHLTPARLFKMGLRENPLCTRYSRDHGDLIHLL